MISGLRLVPLEEGEIWGGAAGTYNRKMGDIEAAGAQMVAMCIIGYILRIARKVNERGAADRRRPSR